MIRFLAGCILIFSLYSCTAPSSVSSSGALNLISASSESYSIPILKRMANNPVHRVRVYVPAGQGTSYTALQLQINSDAVAALDSVKIYGTGSEALFSDKTLLGSAIPVSNNVSIPLSVDVKPGLNYLWVSTVLKPGADIDAKISLRATALTNNRTTLNIATPREPVIHHAGIVLRKPWDDNIHSYRIPGLITTDKGTLIAVYDNRYTQSGDLPENIDVGMSRSTDGGRTWEPMKVIMDMGAPHENNGIGDPSILFDPVTKKLWCAALWSKGNRSIAGSQPGLSPDESGQFVLVSSDDDGKTWSAPYNITAQVKNPIWHIYFNGPGNGIAMQNGTLVFASQYWDETTQPSRVGIPHSSVIYSEDHGKTWKSGIGAKYNTTEAQVVETTPGTLMLNMRDNRGEFRSIATTKDLGKTWLEHPTSYKALPDPVCQGSIIKARVNVKGVMRDVLFFSNVNSSTTRHNMTVKASLDLGETWLPANEVLIDSRRSFGYSCLTKIDDNTLGLLYEGVRDLYFVRVPVSDVIK